MAFITAPVASRKLNRLPTSPILESTGLMKLTFVLREDIFEVCAVATCFLAGYFSWRNGGSIGIEGLLCIAIFASGAAYFYLKKNRARWCDKCSRLMAYGTAESPASGEYAVVYRCPTCARENRAGIYANRRQK